LAGFRQLRHSGGFRAGVTELVVRFHCAEQRSAVIDDKDLRLLGSEA
jgi:hypothetical protein